MTENPTCIALLLCDQMIDDKRSNNKSFIGVFNAIYTQSLPCTHPRLCVLVSLTNVLGSHEVSLSIKTPSDQKVFDAKTMAISADPLQVVDLVFEILGFPILESGTYFIDAFCGGYHVGTRRFQVLAPEAA